MAIKTIDQVDVAGKRVLTRVDFNVPLDDGTVTDDRRLTAALPTIRSIIDRGGRAILMSHLGRPDGDGYEEAFSLKPVAAHLSKLLGKDVIFPDNDSVSEKSAQAIDAMTDGQVLLLENVRFKKGETRNDKALAAKLARYGDIFCNDAFGTAHREHASTLGVPQQMEGKPRVAGFLMRDELKFFDEALRDPKKPFVAVLGGAKVSDKLGVIRNLMTRVDTILIAGAMSYTFLRAQGKPIGSSKAQLGMLDDAREALNAAAASPTDLILPTDHVCGRELTSHSPVRVREVIEDGWMGLDIGPETLAKYTSIIHGAQTVLWNGPVGAFEVSPFDAGTRGIALAIAEATDRGALTIAGGGDTAAAIEENGVADRFSHVSTGGGASLEVVEGKVLATVEILDQN